MMKFFLFFLFILLGVHESLLGQSSVYLCLFLFCVGIVFLIGMLWYFFHFRPITQKLLRFFEDLEFIEAHYLIPEIRNKKSSILFAEQINGNREVFYFKVQGNLFGGLFSYGDNGGIYHRLKDQGRLFNITVGKRNSEYDKRFVVWDPDDEENSDFKKLQAFVDKLREMFNFDFSDDASDILKILNFHLQFYISRLLKKHEQKGFESLFNDLYAIIREIQLAVDETECKVKDDITWFNFRLKILGAAGGDSLAHSFNDYWGDLRPRKMAEDMIEQFKKLPDDSDVLLVKYPSGWTNLSKTINKYLYDRIRNGGRFRLYTADEQMIIRSASMLYNEEQDLYELENREELQQERIFDFILCFNLMQHCRKSKSKAYFRKFSRMLSDNGIFAIVAAVSRDPKIDTFVSERISDRTLMYWDENQFPNQNMFCMNTQEGKIPILLQNLDCNDGKLSFLAKNIYSATKDKTFPNLFCGSLLKVASRGKKIAVSLARKKFISCVSMPEKSIFTVDKEEIPGFDIKEIYLQNLEEEDIAYLTFDFDPGAHLKMHKLKKSENENGKGDLKTYLAAAAKELVYLYPPFLFGENPQPYIDYIFRSVNGETEFSNLFSQIKITAKNKKGKIVRLSICLHKELALDMDGYILAEIDDRVFATYFPGKQLLSEEDFYQYSNDSGEEKISTTHQISWKTLNHRLEQIDCKAETVKFYSVGSQAIYSPFGQDIKKKYHSTENIYEMIANHFSKLNLQEQLLLLDQLDIHDMLVVSRKRKKKKHNQKIIFWDLVSENKIGSVSDIG